jgi:uncharacterized protein YprB with RNaseH-like and TPR domain
LLTKTFCHIQGVGHTTERSLWEEGCEDWDKFLEDPSRYHVGVPGTEAVSKAVRRSKEMLEKGEYQYFRKGLGMAEAWRAWPEFRDSCVYLDIETNGGSSGDSITTIGLYDGSEYTCLIKDQSLDSFRDHISRYSMIVSFFGASFDVPMLQRRFPDVEFDQIHLDLCPTLRRLGIKGGLKKIEKQLGINRGEDTDGLDGLAAIRLWHAYLRRGDEKALETLIAYNREDVVNLERLSAYAYENLRRVTLPPGQYA